MENIASSIESLKSIYLSEIHVDISQELDEELAKAEKAEGFEKVVIWKTFADKWAFVVAQKVPELFEVFTCIMNDGIEIIESGKKQMVKEKEKDKAAFNLKKVKFQKKIKDLEETLEMKDQENCTKKRCIHEKENYTQEIDDLKQNIEKLKSSKENRKELVNEIQELQGKVRNLEEKVVDLKGQIDGLQKKNEGLELKIKKSKGKIRTCKEKITESQGKCSSFEEYLKEKEENLRECSKKIKELQDFIKKIESEKEDLVSVIGHSKDKVSSEEFEKIRNENFELLLQNNELLETLARMEIETRKAPDKQNLRKNMAKYIENSQVFEGKETIRKPPGPAFKAKSCNIKELSLKGLKEIIEDIYEHKKRYDSSYQADHPRVNMNEFLLVYLNQKYGLKVIITEWCMNLKQALYKYEQVDTEISLFSKILQNRVNEGFKNKLDELKEKLKLTFKQIIQQQNPFIREAQVNQILKSKTSGNLSALEIEYILTSFYKDNNDVLHIKNEVNKIIDEKERKLIIGKRNKLVEEKNEISYKELLNLLMFYDLDSWEILLSPFWNLFCEVDEDKNGVISEEEFRDLCQKLSLQDFTENYLDVLDPYERGFVIFSDCVELFDKEMIQKNEFSLSVIHSLFLDNQIS